MWKIKRKVQEIIRTKGIRRMKRRCRNIPDSENLKTGYENLPNCS